MQQVRNELAPPAAMRLQGLLSWLKLMRCHHHFSRLHHLCVQGASAGAVLLVICPDSWPIKHSLIFALSSPQELSFTNLAKQTLLPLLMIAPMLALGLMCLLQHYHYLNYRCLTVAIAGSSTN